MSITSAQYYQSALDESPSSIRLTVNGKEVFVPVDPANRHYREYLEWLAEGNEPLPADETPE
jgi:hypothetical protein